MVFLIASASLAIHADEADNANEADEKVVEQQSPPITKWLDEETVLILELNLEDISPRRLVQWGGELQLLPEPLPEPLLVISEATRASLLGAGANRVFLLVSLRNVIHESMLLIPCNEPEGVRALLEMGIKQVPERYGFRVQQHEHLVGVSTDATWRRLEQRINEPSPEVIESLTARFTPLAKQATLPHRLLISLPRRHRDELAALWPDQLPSMIPLQLSPRQWVEATTVISMEWKLPPSPEVMLRLVAVDQGSAERLGESLRELVGLLPMPNESEQDEGPNQDTIPIRLVGSELTIELSSDVIQGMLKTLPQPPIQSPADGANQLKQIGLAIHNYHASHQTLPPRASVTPEGKGLLSGRVYLLPYLEQLAMYNQFHLDKPWDSPENQIFTETVIPAFTLPSDRLPPGQTRIRFPVLEGSLWQGDGPPRKFSEVTDGTSNTIAAAIAPVDNAIPWTNPEPWQLDPENLIDSFFGDRDETWVLMLDGSARRLERTIEAETLRAMLTHAGGEVIP